MIKVGILSFQKILLNPNSKIKDKMSAVICNMHSLQSTVYRHLSTLAFFDVRDKQLLSSLCICVQKMDRGREKVLKG